MNTDNNKKIDDYLNGNLSEQELDAFQKALKDDPSLADEVELSRLMQKGIERLKEQDLRNKMKQWQLPMMPKAENYELNEKEEMPDSFDTAPNSPYGARSTPSQSISWLWLLLPLLLTLGYYLWKNSSSKTASPTIGNPKRVPIDTLKNNLPQADIEPENDTKVPLRTPNTPPPNHQYQTRDAPQVNDDKNETLALTYYQAPKNDDIVFKSDKNNGSVQRNQDSEPENITELIEKAQKGSVLAQYEVAHFYFRAKNYPLAADNFSQISQKDTGELGDSALWYWALAVTAQGKKELAKQILGKIIAENNHDKLEEAKELLYKLNIEHR